MDPILKGERELLRDADRGKSGSGSRGRTKGFFNSQPKQHKPLQQQYQQSQIGTISQLVAGGSCGCTKQDLHCTSCTPHHTLSGARHALRCCDIEES
ncbi:hypothetical protein NC651_019100 [Populus alba x Populus x berolinensis]|nr:hypothetical protein NC651_019100 [Populus alba x Populus x berolinensis]